jgi:hypothetical protein
MSLKAMALTRNFCMYVKCSEISTIYLQKGKAHPLQAMQAQKGLGELRLLDFLTSELYGSRLSASRTGRLYPQGHPW